MLLGKRFPKSFWPEAVKWSISVHWFKVLGCLAHVHNAHIKKLDKRIIVSKDVLFEETKE